jgi:hypothetical protein
VTAIARDRVPRCLFCDQRPVGYFDSRPRHWDEWCGVCPVGITYEQYLERKVKRALGDEGAPPAVDPPAP